MFRDKNNLEILKKALAVIAEEEAAKLPSEEECADITFSEEFERKMERIIRFQKKPYYSYVNTVGKRVACIILAILIAFTTVTFSVKAFREAVLEFFVETFEKFSIVGFNEEDLDNSLDHIETYYAPTYIPEGYELEYDRKSPSMRRMKFYCENEYIYFSQRLINDSDYYLDTENADVEYIEVEGLNDGYLAQKDNKITLCWNDDAYAYSIYSTGKFAEKELVMIAESITIE